MANARKSNDSELERLNEAMERYAEQARKIPGVAAVIVVPGEERDISTFIDERDEEVIERLLDVEDDLFATFDDQLFDFHVWYLSGRPLDEHLPAVHRMIYRRGDSK